MENIKAWYMLSFSDDDMGKELSSSATFGGLFETLDSYEDVYEYLFGDPMKGDTIVRERVFARLAGLLSVPYEYVYEQWLKGA